jgi:hypothetical protein
MVAKDTKKNVEQNVESEQESTKQRFEKAAQEQNDIPTKEIQAPKKCCKSTSFISGLHIILVSICLYGVFHYYTKLMELELEITEKPCLILMGKMGAAACLALLISFSRSFYLDKCN